MTFWSSTKRFAGLWGFAAFVALVAILFHRVLLPFVLALLLAYVLSPLVDRLYRLKIAGRRLPRFAGVIIIYLGIVTSLGLFLGVFLPRLSSDFSHLLREAPAFFTKVEHVYAPRATNWLEDQFPSEKADDDKDDDGPRPERRIQVRQIAPGQLDVSLEGMELEVTTAGKGRYVIGPRRDSGSERPLRHLLANIARSSQTEVFEVLRFGQRFIAAIVKAIASLILVLMVAAFLLVDADRVHGFLRGLVPDAFHDDYDQLAVEIDRGLAGVIRGQFVICTVNALLTYAGLLILHVKYPLILGLIAGVMSLIPVFGSILSSVPIVAVALVGEGGLLIGRGFATLGWIIGIHLLEANLLNPNIIGNAAKIHPVLVIFALIVGEQSGGLLGALIAVPVASIIQTFFLFFYRRRTAGMSSSPHPLALEEQRSAVGRGEAT